MASFKRGPTKIDAIVLREKGEAWGGRDRSVLRGMREEFLKPV